MREIEVIGQMDNTKDHTFESANRVYGTDGISPTINTCGGGGLEPKVIDIKKLGNINPKSNQRTSVYDTDGISPTLKAAMGAGGNQMPMHVEVKALAEQNMIVRDETFGTLTTDGSSPKHNNRVAYIARMCGRNPENPSDRTPGIYLEQRLEPNAEGICNTLTSVQKDNLVIETEKPKIKVRQATEQGFVEVEIGGGGRPGVPYIADKTWQSNRERHSESDSDNGEYP